MSARSLLLSLLALAWVAAVLLAGCTGPAAGPVPTPAPTPPMTPNPLPGERDTFTQADSGGTFPLPLDGVIQLRLAENPTTGYRWNLSITSGLLLLNDSFIPDDPTGKLVGSGGTRVWFLKAVREGEQGISGSYARPWEPAGPGVAFFTLTLIVSGGSCAAEVCTIPPTSPAVPPGYHVYTGADSGRTVEEPLGGTFGIRLQANPSTGYSWNLSLTPGLSLSGDEYIASPLPGQRVGAGGIQAYTIITKEKGDQRVRAEYRQPWISSGTVTYVDLEGGFYGILGDDGEKYDPQNLDAQYKEDGLRVAFHATGAEGIATIHMWGTPVNLDFIEEIQGFALSVTVT